MLITGTINTVVTKLIFGSNEAVGCCGWTSKGIPNTIPHSFSHPWFSTWVMFVGELLCFIPFLISRSRKTPEEKTDNPYSYIFAIPTCCDLTASTLGNISLLWIPASIWQMMRGAIIIFSAILSAIFLRKKLLLHHWVGIIIVVAGLFLVGLSGFLTGSNGGNSNLFALGIFLVVIAQIISASQMVLEETLLKDRNYEPMNVVFMEGFWGVVIMMFVVLPILYIPRGQAASPPYINVIEDGAAEIYSENVLDALTQMWNNPIFFYENLVFVFSIAFYNFFGLALTTYLSAVHRTLIDACRTISVWLVQVFFYWIGLEQVGEKLTILSLLQLAGFICLVTGTVIYNEVVKLPCSSYPDKKQTIND